jgi:parallel beta-helix repeat protein
MHLLIYAGAIVVCFRTYASTIFVSPDGDDSATGDQSHPFKTISRAADWARAGDTVLIAPGTYREAVQLTHSGTPEKPITFQAQTPGTAIVSGADQLTIWTPVVTHPGPYLADWPYDFIIDHNPDGSPIRSHGAEPSVGCAEQILFEGHPLRQVMNNDDLSPGTFFVDWQFHTLAVWLPGGMDPRNTNVEGSVREFTFAPLEQNNVFSDVRYITVRGLVFRDTANFAQRGGMILGTGWHALNCIVEGDNAGGMSLNGDHILVDHCTLQFNGFCGLSGSGNFNTIQDCIVRGNNWKGFPPSWEGGGGKFCQTDHLTVTRHQSYDNTGPGLWLDIDNTNYSITNSIFHGNHGLAADWEGSGICLEISPGPGVVTGNTIYSNTGAGILLAESEHITVQSNTFVDNTKGVELRAMSNRDNHELKFIDITQNRFKEWRSGAIVTSIGDWSPTSVAQRQIKIDQNTYDSLPDKPFFTWGDSSLTDIPDIRSALGLEQNGARGQIELRYPLEDAKSICDPDRLTIAKAIKSAQPGSTVTIPAACRSPLFPDGTCAIYDRDNNCLALSVPAELRDRLQETISNWPSIVPILLEIRLDQNGPNHDVRGTLVEIK